MWNSKTLKTQNMFQNFFRISKLQKAFTTYKWVIIHDVSKKVIPKV
jgi:hypothetical protein